jgi:hypothetical protein
MEPEARLREMWTARGVSQEKQDAILADIARKASPEYLDQVFKREHVCTPETCPEPGIYYVTAKDGPQWWKMAGPYPTHEAALADVDRALRIASDNAPKAWFMNWGTARMKDGTTEPGNLNKAGLI